MWFSTATESWASLWMVVASLHSPAPGMFADRWLTDDGHVASPEFVVPFLGSEAISSGRMTSHSLRTRHRRLFPDVYVPVAVPLEPHTLVRAAALWAPSGSVVGGLGAAVLHGERWFAPESVLREIDVYSVGTPHVPKGVRLRRLGRELPAGHVGTADDVPLTSVARTAIDVGRWAPGQNICKIYEERSQETEGVQTER